MPGRRKYIRRVLALLPCSRAERQWMRARLEETVDPGLRFATLCAQLGTPEELAASYVDTLSAPELVHKLAARRRVTGLAFSLVLALLLSWAGTVGYALDRVSNQRDVTIVIRFESICMEYRL